MQTGQKDKKRSVKKPKEPASKRSASYTTGLEELSVKDSSDSDSVVSIGKKGTMDQNAIKTQLGWCTEDEGGFISHAVFP